MRRRLSVLIACLTALALLIGIGWQVTRSDSKAAHAIDIGFAQSMLVHHRQAVAMAQLVLADDTTGLTRLAQQILRTQLVEVGEMQGWLKLWGASLNPQPVRMDWMRLGDAPLAGELREYLLECERSPTGMPGLATLAELEVLRAASGLEADARFLELMIAHHVGGIPMARFAAQQAKHPVVRQLARTIALEQSREIEIMRRTLVLVRAKQNVPQTGGAGGQP